MCLLIFVLYKLTIICCPLILLFIPVALSSCHAGFADIPSGPSCPYIVRRGLLGTSVVPVPQKKQKEEETD